MHHPKCLDYAVYMLPFELLSRDINRTEFPYEDKEFIESRLKDSAFRHLLHLDRAL